ncbi:hypothetical protein MSG28_007977 [Choristoneura fumiferana]|uniref:Uncharacterized protein n=1 Tax=Choristoneura fumiferana TaxID=7141 RepID=A0ACC0J9K2_CHOFU|nr:hypothetical protein MSG28_007977 [Choristoneura fumiferana]
MMKNRKGKKIRRYERKLNRLKQNLSEDSEVQHQPGPSQSSFEEPKDNYTEETEIQATDESLPEEFLLALGEEGNISEKIGDSIRQELVDRWENIMKTGIFKEKWTSLTEKYLTPSNFPKAIAPKLNSELVAALSETMIKRDKKFEYRQNLIGKILSCLGSLLTDIMKGNLNSLKLIEGINDSAKILCNMYYYDNIVRKHLALSSLPGSVKQAIASAPTDTYLLGENLSERLKAAKAIERNGTLLQQSKQPAKKPPPKTNLNWKGPSQKFPQKSNRARGGPRNQQYQQYQPNQPYQPHHQQQHQRRPASRPQQPKRRR